MEENRTLSDTEKVRRIQVSLELERVTLMEEISLRRNHGGSMTKGGDWCTTFFHRVANSHGRNNDIEMLSIDGLVSSDQSGIKDHIGSIL